MTDRAIILGYFGYAQPEPGTAPPLHFFRDSEIANRWRDLGFSRLIEPIYWDGSKPYTLRTHPVTEEPQ